MKQKEILAKAIEIVTFLFAGFGFFLKSAAPPDKVIQAGGNPSNFALGISSFLTLMLLLLVSAIAQRRGAGKRNRWLLASVVLMLLTLASGFTYQWCLLKLTFSYPPEAPYVTYVAGTELQPIAQKWRDKGRSNAEVMEIFGGPKYIDSVWTSQSQDRAQMLLILVYVWFVLSTASAIFSLIEAVQANPDLMERKVGGVEPTLISESDDNQNATEKQHDSI